MHDVNKWLLALAFLIGLVLTFALMIRRVTREVPVTHTVSAGVRGKLDGPDLDLGKVAGSVAAAGSAAAAGAGATLSGAADRVGEFVETVGDKIEGLFERDIHGAGSARLTARRDAPAGYTVKFDPDTKRYLTAGDAGYAELETEYWFTDEASAKAAGFSRWEEFKDKVGDLVDRAGDKIGAAAGAVGAAAGAVGDKVGGAFDTAADKVGGAFDTATDKAGAAAGAAGLLGGAVASIDEVEAGPYGRGSAAAGAGGSGPAGWLIKGNADSMLYHPPDSPAYNQTIAEVWFFDEESARKAGFDKWDKNFT